MTYDVVVVGGGAGGVAAAVGAAESGARTLLVERYGMLGGVASTASVLTYCGFFTQGEPWEKVVAGVGDRVLARLRDLGVADTTVTARTGNKIVLLDQEAVKIALDRLVAEAGVDVRFHALAIAATAGERVESVTVAGDGGAQELPAAAFVDATGHANLAFLAGARTEQPAAGVPYQASTMMMRIGGIDAPVDRESVAAAIRAADRPFPREEGVVVRLPLSHDVLAILADVDCDPFAPDQLSLAERRGRALAWDYLDALRRHHPGAERAYLVATGPQLGVREGRRIVGRDLVSRADVLAARRRADGIARCGWPIEAHPEIGRSVYESVGGHGWYHIPLGALISASHPNLLAAGRTVSADRAAFASLRVMGTAFATGHAAGVAAAHYAATGTHDATAVRTALLRQGALI